MSFTVRQRSPRVKNGYLDEQPEISEMSPRMSLEILHIPLPTARSMLLLVSPQRAENVADVGQLSGCCHFPRFCC